MTHAESVPGAEAPSASVTLTHSQIEPAVTTALPAGCRSSIRPGGQSNESPHRSEAQTSTVVGWGIGGSAMAIRTARRMSAHRAPGTP